MKSDTPKERKSANIAEQARESVLESLFDDMYRKRWKVYHFNFVRGMFFGLGSAIGGTVVLAFVVWLLSWTVDWPWIGRYVEQLIK